MIFENSLEYKDPELSAQWHPSHNGKLTPAHVTTGSNKKVWWKCNKGHEWHASIKSRTISSRSNGVGCPICSGHKVIQGINDLANEAPQLALEWHTIKNGELTPAEVTLHSNRSVWWQCIEGHTWKTTVNNRANGSGCPFCNQNRLIPSETSLSVVNPELAEEWHPSKNGEITPYDVPAFDNYKYWWQCSKGHQWETTVANRSNGTGCPYCTGRIPILGETDLATNNPKLAKEWHSSKNGYLKPSDVTEFADKKVWWVCFKGHVWPASVASRSYGSGCPYCSGMLPITGVTDLATKNSKLVTEWNHNKNKTLSPADVTEFSSKKVWWKCSNGHEWQATVASRSQGTGCPYCAGMLPVAGVTDLATKNSKLATEWNYNKKALDPSDVTEFSSKKVWWKCSNGHDWQASVTSRSQGAGCPYCAGMLPVAGVTDLATKNSKLATEWNYNKNKALDPSDVTEFSSKKVWWKCSNGHEWQASVTSRSYGSGCPICKGMKPSVPRKIIH